MVGNIVEFCTVNICDIVAKKEEILVEANDIYSSAKSTANALIELGSGAALNTYPT